MPAFTPLFPAHPGQPTHRQSPSGTGRCRGCAAGCTPRSLGWRGWGRGWERGSPPQARQQEAAGERRWLGWRRWRGCRRWRRSRTGRWSRWLPGNQILPRCQWDSWPRTVGKGGSRVARSVFQGSWWGYAGMLTTKSSWAWRCRGQEPCLSLRLGTCGRQGSLAGHQSHAQRRKQGHATHGAVVL